MTDTFVHPYLPNSAPAVKAAMLAATGAASTEEFYADVPAELRVTGLLDLPEALPAEQDLAAHVTQLLERNRPVAAGQSFLGAGTYRHYVPAVVDEVINRSEFLTAYAGEPYEDHGRFQALETGDGEVFRCGLAFRAEAADLQGLGEGFRVA